MQCHETCGHGGVLGGGGGELVGLERKEEEKVWWWCIMGDRVTNEMLIKVAMHRNDIKTCMGPSLIILCRVISFDLSYSKE